MAPNGEIFSRCSLRLEYHELEASGRRSHLQQLNAMASFGSTIEKISCNFGVRGMCELLFQQERFRKNKSRLKTNGAACGEISGGPGGASAIAVNAFI